MDLRQAPSPFWKRHAPAVLAGLGVHAALWGALQWWGGPSAPALAPQVVQALLLSAPVPTARPAAPPSIAPPVPTSAPTPAPARPLAPVSPAPAPALMTTPTPVSPSAPAVSAAPALAPAASGAAASASASATASVAKGVRTAAAVQAGACEKPAYPSASVRLEEEGTVHVRFLVGVDGRVIQSEVVKSSGFKRLDEAARTGLAKCLFKPATVDGQAEQAWATIQYTWRLE